MGVVKKLKQDGRRIIVCTDIHGHLPRLLAALQSVNWNPDSDLLLCAGDLIDRGPNSLAVLDFAKHNMECVLGNHDSFLLDHFTGYTDTYSTWMVNGGSWFHHLSDEEQAEVEKQYKDWLVEVPLAIEVELGTGELIGVVHAEVSPAIDNWETFKHNLECSNLVIQSAIWGRTRVRRYTRLPPVTGIKYIVSGHTVLDTALIAHNTVYIDTGAVFGGPTTLAIFNKHSGTLEVVECDKR